MHARVCKGVCSPLVAGLQVVNLTANSVCSIGPVGWKVDSLQPSQPDFNYKVILSAAHCTSSQSAVFGDVVYQPAPNRAVGYEVDEAPVYGASTCNALGKPYIYCRYADVTVYRVLDSVAIAAGNAAKSAPTTPPANPPYLGMLPYTGSGVIGVLVGELVNRVGATSGKDSALVTHDCVDKPSGLSGIYTLCMQRANIRVRDGDSGGLIYLTQGSNPKPRPAGVTSRGEDNPNAVGVYYSKMSLVLGALGYKYFVSW